MKYVLLFVIVLPALSLAQSTVTGLGTYTIGITTPDLLNRTEFTEEDQSYVKGTIALPCTHIRTFTATTAKIGGVLVANVALTFYDNKLFKIACEYSDSLQAAFTERHGSGVGKPVSRFQFCPDEDNKPLLVWGDVWLSDDVLTLVVYVSGYTADCKRKQGATLLIASQRMTALSSDCDLKSTDPLTEEYIRSL